MSTTDDALNEELIGRADVHDLEAILAVTNTERDAVISAVADHSDAIFTWDYEKGARPPLEKLYEKAKVSKWNGETDLPWDTEVDQEKVVIANAEAGNAQGLGLADFDVAGTPFEKWGDEEWMKLGIESQNWTLSQFMHGEQGALICTAKIVETVPWIDAKYYASTQVMDEARHVEVFAKYLDTKLSGHYPVNAHLKMLLDDIVNDSRWDMTYLGMQIMVEGLALAAFGFMHQMTTEPLLKQLLRYVMSDEARHVAFGVLSLQGVLRGPVRRRDLRAPAVRVRGRGAHARPLPAAGGLGAHGRAGQGGDRAGDAHAHPPGVPDDAVLEDRPELQEARAARPQRRVAAAPLRGDRRHPVRGLGRHRRRVRELRADRRASCAPPERGRGPASTARCPERRWGLR